MSARLAKIEDVHQIIECGKSYYDESIFYKDLTFSAENSLTTTLDRICSDDCLFIVYERNEQIIGFFVSSYDSSCTVEEVLFEEKFYIHPDYRNARIAIEMMDCWVELTKQRPYAKAFSTSTAGLDADGKSANVFTKLFEKYGFTKIPNGYVLIKETTR